MSADVNITESNARSSRLGDVATLRAGYAFRSAIPESATGGVVVVQLKDIQIGERLDWSRPIRTILSRAPLGEEWLRPGDILFAFRGTRYFAVLLEEVPAPAIAATQFMLLRVRDTQALLPAFLAWQLNQPPAQLHFHQAATGTAQRSLRRGAVEALTVAVPPMEFQHSVVELAVLVRREREAMQEFIRTREQQLSEIAASLLAISPPGEAP